jgi:glycosyltransferase involved in cell wall biosynthesis
MSPANLNYVLDHNPDLTKYKIEINPNSIEIKEGLSIKNPRTYRKYNIPSDKIIFIFGGNLGIPQSINLLKEHISYCKSIEKAFFLIVGDGTEYENFKNWIQTDAVKNVLLIKELPKMEYDEIIAISHVGLIFLNPNFTIPNFPSRILSYMQNKLPVICATDIITDIGTIASENGYGYSCLTNDLESFYNFVTKLLDGNLREEMGNKAFKYLNKEYSVESSYYKIIEKLNH